MKKVIQKITGGWILQVHAASLPRERMETHPEESGFKQPFFLLLVALRQPSTFTILRPEEENAFLKI